MKYEVSGIVSAPQRLRGVEGVNSVGSPKLSTEKAGRKRLLNVNAMKWLWRTERRDKENWKICGFVCDVRRGICNFLNLVFAVVFVLSNSMSKITHLRRRRCSSNWKAER